jgi:hypothetical protein
VLVVTRTEDTIMSRFTWNTVPLTCARAPIALAATLMLAIGCEVDRAMSVADSELAAATVADVRGEYHGTGTVKVTTNVGWSGSGTCSGTVSVLSQDADRFSGTFVLEQNSGDCDSESGTLWGTVAENNDVSLMADTERPGANVWEDVAARYDCRLLSGTPLTGSVAGGTLSFSGRGSYDCPTAFGTIRAVVEVTVQAARG